MDDDAPTFPITELTQEGVSENLTLYGTAFVLEADDGRQFLVHPTAVSVVRLKKARLING